MWLQPAAAWKNATQPLVKTGQDGQRIDYFRADKAWWYITLLTIGYMIARGLAKSGSREPYDDDRSH